MYQDDNYLQQLEDELQFEKQKNIDIQRANAPMMFGAENNDNLVKWQLDIKEELERIEHLLRKHIPKRDEHGNEYFEEASEENQLFNEYGVQEILNILAWYLNKSVILSNYSEEDIKLRVHQFADELTDFIHNNYEKFGWNTIDKMKHYRIIVMNLVNIVEASYNRALGGGERESLRTARQVYQTEPLNNMRMGSSIGGNMQQPSSSKFSLLNPKTWA